MNTRRVVPIIVGVVILAAAVVALMIANRSGGRSELRTASLRLAWLPGATFAGDYVALKQGYWSEAGIEITVRPGGFDADALRSVASGVDTFGVTSLPQLLFARANGVPVRAIGATIPMSPIGWVAKQDSRIARPEDFKGHRVGSQFGTHTEVTLEALCDRLGISLDSFNRIPVQFDPTPFVNGDIDVLPVYLIDQPVDLRANGILLNEINPADYGVALGYGNVYFATEATIANRPQLVRSFLAGARKGWLEAKANPLRAVESIRVAAPEVNARTLESKLQATFDFIAKTDSNYLGVFPLDMQRVGATKDILSKYGKLPKDVDSRQSYSNEFLH